GRYLFSFDSDRLLRRLHAFPTRRSYDLRLAIAQAMLGLPDLLVLDEPANGHDPPQIREMREVLKRYARDGRTVIVSSHLLAEVEDRKSTRLNCSHVKISYAVFCLKKKTA